jgi:hypothetical protein
MGAHLAARRKGFFKLVTRHMLTHGESMTRGRTTWTKDACMRSAKRYRSRSAWERGHHKAYQAAKRHGWYEACTADMTRRKKINGYWNRKNCLAEAKKHSYIRDWANASASSYQVAMSNPKWFATCTAHMERIELRAANITSRLHSAYPESTSRKGTQIKKEESAAAIN